MPSLITDILRDIINDEKKANEFAIKAANYQKNADYENAEKYYIQALHYQWNNAIYWNGIAWSRLLANKADEFALNVVNTAILFDNQNHYIRDTKACIQAQLGLISEAINEWRYALALNPGNQNYQNKLFKALGTV
ncbi:MAG: hypothetical protein MUF15_23510, partial [Acidobacteria bacterium]|nr:hypothetical protein [Acidobacteriota bacterium]